MGMKNVLLLINLFIFCKSNAQDLWNTGVFLGIGHSGTFHSEANDMEKNTFSAGFAAQRKVNSWFSLQANALLTRKSAALSYTSGEHNIHETYKIYYLEIPFLAEISLGKQNWKLHGYGGPSLNTKLSATRSVKMMQVSGMYENGIPPSVADAELSLLTGAGIEWNYNERKYVIDVRWSFGQTPALKTYIENIFTRYWVIGAGYYF